MCYNCNRKALHLAMYCDKPQKIRRCSECWAAATRDIDHAPSCFSRRNFGELGPNDVAHRIQPRLMIRTNGSPIRLYENQKTVTPWVGTMYRSQIAENITYHFVNKHGFCVLGPSTMYFRIPVIVGKSVAFRIDVLFDSMNIVVIKQHVDNLPAVSNSGQTVCAIKMSKMAQNLEIASSSQSYSVTFAQNEDEISVEKIEKGAVDIVAANVFQTLEAIEN